MKYVCHLKTYLYSLDFQAQLKNIGLRNPSVSGSILRVELKFLFLLSYTRDILISLHSTAEPTKKIYHSSSSISFDSYSLVSFSPKGRLLQGHISPSNPSNGWQKCAVKRQLPAPSISHSQVRACCCRLPHGHTRQPFP